MTTNYNDRRLRSGPNVQRLVEILCKLEPDPSKMFDFADLAGLSMENINRQAGTPVSTWLALIGVADKTGKFDALMTSVIGWRQGWRAADELQAWLATTGIDDIAGLAVEVRDQLAVMMSTSAPFLDAPAAALASAIRDLGERLDRPDVSTKVNDGLTEPQRYVERARGAVRNALAAVDSLLYQARDAASFLQESAAAVDRRDEASHRIANYGLVDFVLRQRAVADHAVTTLVDLLRAMFPAAFYQAPSPARE